MLFVYNRPDHTRQTIEALKANKLADQSDLIIYSDGAKKQSLQSDVDSVRQYISTVDVFKSVKVIERDKNWGLADSIIDGVTETINKYGKIIVLEDDLVTSKNFLNYMNQSLHFFENKPHIFSINGYNYPPSILHIPSAYSNDVYFSVRPHSWGWATWSNKWEKADWQVKDFKDFISNPNNIKTFNKGGDDLSWMLLKQMMGKIDSWAIRWCFTHYKHNALSVYPVRSQVNNIGHDGSGTHCGIDRKGNLKNDLYDNLQEHRFPKEIKLDQQLLHNYKAVFSRSIVQKIRFSIGSVYFRKYLMKQFK